MTRRCSYAKAISRPVASGDAAGDMPARIPWDALDRHFRSKDCIRPLKDEENHDWQRAWDEMAQTTQQKQPRASFNNQR